MNPSLQFTKIDILKRFKLASEVLQLLITMQQEISAIRSLYYPVRTDQFARVGHRIVNIQNHIFIFGGVSPNGDYNSSIIKIDCQTMTLDLVHTINPLKLQNFTLFCYGGQVYFWGGSAPKKQDPRVSVCQRKLIKFEQGQFIVIEQGGKIPCARQCHASCTVSGKYLVIMGGNNGKSFFNDWHILQFSSMTWAPLSVNRDIPPFLDAQLFWSGGRGFMFTGESFDKNNQKIATSNKIYQFRFIDFRERKLEVDFVTVSTGCQQRNPRGSPSAVLVNLESPYIMLIGGTVRSDKDFLGICNQIQCFNLETLEWFTVKSDLKSGLAFEALYNNEKIYLVGGVGRNREVATFVEYIELKIDYLESKICKVCRQVYGVKQLNGNNSFAIKIEADSCQKTFFSSEIVGRMASYISYPFSALGLLLDNSLNLSGTNIDIQFELEPGSSMEEEKKQSLPLRQRNIPYNYISIIDNSFGFTQHQILECLNSFTVKTEKLTSDKRYEEEIQIRKEYGINLKLGALRLGKSCLFITRTEDRSKLFAYFSVSAYYSSTPFSVHAYILSPEGICSSEINRRLIRQNVRGRIPANYEEISAPTIVYIFDIDRIELSVKNEQGYGTVLYKQSLNKVYRELGEYLSSLYLNPYKGRRMVLNGKEIKFRAYLDIFKKDTKAGDLIEVTDEEYPKELFACLHLYKVQSDNYFFKSILCYHRNRLIFPVNGIDSRFCGVVELSETLKVDICKTKIEHRNDELLVYRVIRSIINKYQLKRMPKLGLARPVMQPSKERATEVRAGGAAGGQDENQPSRCLDKR